MSNSGQSGWNLVKTAVGKFPIKPRYRGTQPDSRFSRPFHARDCLARARQMINLARLSLSSGGNF